MEWILIGLVLAILIRSLSNRSGDSDFPLPVIPHGFHSPPPPVCKIPTPDGNFLYLWVTHDNLLKWATGESSPDNDIT